MLMAEFSLPAFGAKVTMSRTPSSMVNLEWNDLPEAIKDEMVYFAISPATKARYEECLEQGLLTEAYDIWNKAAETHLTLQLKSMTLPSKRAGPYL